MQRILSAAACAAAVAFGLATVASSQPFQTRPVVERSGNVFHRQACAGPAIAGVARCHAHIVTDPEGNDFERNVTRNITPSGFGPSQLRQAYAISASGSSATTIAI